MAHSHSKRYKEWWQPANARTDLNSWFDALEPKRSARQPRQLEGFGRLVGLWIGTVHLDHVTTLTQDEQPVFTLGKIVNETAQPMNVPPHIDGQKWAEVGSWGPTYVGMRRPFERLHRPRNANEPDGVVFFPDSEEEHGAVWALRGQRVVKHHSNE